MRTLKSIINHYMRIVVLALIVTLMIIILYFQVANERQQAYRQAKETFYQIDQVLEENSAELTDIQKSYKDTCRHNAGVIAYIIEARPSVLDSVEELRHIAELVEVDEIHIFDTSGRIFTGTHPEYYGYTFDSGEQIGFFKPLLNDKFLCLVQDITPNTAEDKMMQYSALWSRNGKYIVQVGMEPVNVLKVTEKNELSHIFSLLRVNSEANYYAINKESGKIVGSTDLSCVEKNSSEIGLDFETIVIDEDGFYTNVNDIKSYCVFMESGENYIGRVISCQDLYQQVPFTMLEFAICLVAVVMILFYVVTYCTNKYVIEGIYSINNKLHIISQGDLDETVDVKSSLEFAELSRYINQMKKSMMENYRKMSYVISKAQMAIGVYECNPQMKKVYLSEYVPEILDLEPQECERLAADYKVFRKFIDDLRKNTVEDEVCVYHYRQHYFKLYEIEDNDDVFGVIIDVTAGVERRKKIEGEREAKSRFLYNMSHEIRTPINAILGMNEMILRETRDKQILTYSSNVQSSGKMLLSLVNDILDASKIESGKMEIIPAEYKMSNVIMDLWNVIYLRAKEKNLALGVEVDETLPCVLYGDDVRVKQIVTNLLTNAVKYTKEGSVRLKIAYERQNDDGLLLKISVQDTGIGIREEDMGKLFESFQRIDEEANRNIEGTGLGMNITMSLLKMMGGDMKVDSEYQKGSTFTVSIPQKIISDDPTGSFQQIQERNSQQNGSKGGGFIAPEGCTLVVDDNEMNRTVFKALLKRTKMQVVTAESGKQCLEYVQKQKFHIIFMDHMMPEMDGIETLHHIKELSDYPCENTPIVVLTANAVSGAKKRYLSEGFDDFLSKPIVPAKLENMIKKMLPEELLSEAVCGTQAEGRQDREPAAPPEDLPPVDGLDWQYAWLHLPDRELLEYTVKEFYGQIDCAADRLEQFYEQLTEPEQLAQYRIQVHGMKSLAATVGIVPLSGMAKILEYAARDGKINVIMSITAPFLEEWRSYRQKLQGVFGIEAETKREVTDHSIIKALVEMVRISMQEMDIDQADQAMGQLQTYEYPEEIEQNIRRLAEAVTNLNPEEADRLAELLIGQM